MERQNWLWMRKSIDKSLGERESSGSLSFHSGNFSDDQAYAAYNSQSPEVASRLAPAEEVLNDIVKTLMERLSGALLDIKAKEESIEQHAKVAEEAVSGWEKAENEVFALKQQLEAAGKKNKTLEDQVSHLDGALKECLWQIRQAREDNQRRIEEAVAEQALFWESRMAELQDQLIDLKAQTKTIADHDFCSKLEYAEKENLRLKLELLSLADEIEFRILERDLSTQAAESASKQYLESIKKVAKLEAECRRLKASSRKVSLINDHPCFSASSTYAESFTDSQSDNGERLSAINSLTVPSIEINLMDDFLEMERLVALPDTESGNFYHEACSSKSLLKAEVETLSRGNSELHQKLENAEKEKEEVEIALSACQRQLEISKGRLKQAEIELIQLKPQLVLANELKQAVAEKLAASDENRNRAESQLRVAEDEIRTLILKVGSLEAQLEHECGLLAENVARCETLNDDISIMKTQAEIQKKNEIQSVASLNEKLKIKQEKELAVAASKYKECQKTILSLGYQLESLATLEDLSIKFDKPFNLRIDGVTV